MKKKILNKLFATGLAVAMTMGLIACGSNTANTQSEANSEPKESSKAATEEKEVVSEPKEPVELRLVMYGDVTDRKEEFLANEFHDRVLEELNIDMTIEWFPWSEQNGSTIINMLSSGEEFAFENIPAKTDFHMKGYLAEISMDDIEANMPDYLDMRGENNGFDCASYQGKIYGIPIGNKPYSGKDQGLAVRNEILNEAGWDASDIKTYDDFMDAVAAVRAIYPNMTVMNKNGYTRIIFSESLGGINMAESTDNYCIVDEDTEDDTVISYYESELFENTCKMFEEWVELGYQRTDILTNKGQYEADFQAGNCLFWPSQGSQLVETSLRAKFPGIDIKHIKFDDKQFIKTRDYDWGISFSANEAEKIPYWLEFFNWIYEDVENYNFCIYGVEGTDWQYKEDGTIEKLVDETFWDEWFLQASKYQIFDSSIPQENIDAYMAYDDGSKLSKRAGFTFDSSEVETEKALLSAVVTEYLQPLESGLGNFDEDYPEALKKLKEAGLDKYVAEYQRQYSEWYANR